MKHVQYQKPIDSPDWLRGGEGSRRWLPDATADELLAAGYAIPIEAVVDPQPEPPPVVNDPQPEPPVLDPLPVVDEIPE